VTISIASSTWSRLAVARRYDSWKIHIFLHGEGHEGSSGRGARQLSESDAKQFA
jgi:hypothetical protein